MPLPSDLDAPPAAGSPADFDGLFQAHYDALTRVVYRIVGDRDSAEELAAETFWKFHCRPPASRHNLAGWLHRTALRLALDHLKKQRRRERYEAQSHSPARVETPEETLAVRERAALVREVLASLKPQQTELLVLRSEGCSLSEIAALLALNPASVGTFLSRADAAFRKEYRSRYGEL